jgi:hypothetical protein
MKKLAHPCTVFGVPNTPYAPPNLPSGIRPAQITCVTPEEQALLP